MATAKSALEAAIAEKADTATLNEKVTELNTAIDNAKKASNAYADTQDNALKEELTNLINIGDSALQTAIDAVSTNLNQAKGELETKIKTNADDLLAAKTSTTKKWMQSKSLSPIFRLQTHHRRGYLSNFRPTLPPLRAT